MKIIQTPVGHMEVFCYLIYDEKSGEGVLIDPAGDEDRLLRLVQQNGLSLRYIVNTHGHADHTCGNARLQATTGAAIVIHAGPDDGVTDPTGGVAGLHPRLVVGPPGSADRVRTGAVVEMSPGEFLNAYAYVTAVEGGWQHTPGVTITTTSCQSASRPW